VFPGDGFSALRIFKVYLNDEGRLRVGAKERVTLAVRYWIEFVRGYWQQG
jgi:hypothetical protein